MLNLKPDIAIFCISSLNPENKDKVLHFAILLYPKIKLFNSDKQRKTALRCRR